MAVLGLDSKVTHKGRPVWHEGSEEFSAAESDDRAAEVMLARIEENE